MKTLVFIGAAREKGRSREMLDIFLQDLKGEVEIIDAYRTSVAPCKDCRYCWKKRGCSIKDGMQEIYRKVDEADNIVLAAPMYFHTVPGPMKVMLDRFQVYWASHVRKDRPDQYIKKGVVLMVGGAPSFERQFLAGEIVLKGLLHDFAAECVGMVTFPDTDRRAVSDDPEVVASLKKLAGDINQYA